ncbi:MAG TPA: PilZ domain-containing protein [Planctomycetota bacterium]|nr:PilZ domain-containing protein [Planctomycetota bacterium]
MPKIKTNKRKELRFSIQNGKAQMESSGGIFAFLKGAPAALPIVNLSTTGLRLLAKKKMMVGDKLSLNIVIPLLGANPLKLSGQVAWVKTFAIFDEYIVGVKFGALRGDAVKRLKNLADFLGTRVNPDRKIILKEVKKKTNSCVICQFADKKQQGGTSTLKIGSFHI